MVFFICNGCGETLKKVKVEHHKHVCRSCSYVSCMDCNKDFHGDEFSSHTFCMTEDQKYGGKDFVPKEMKGLNKQLDFMSNFKKIVSESKNMEPQLSQICEKVINEGNVPKKEKAFNNYCKSNKFSECHQKALWEFVQKAKSIADSAKNEADSKASKRKLEENELCSEEKPSKKNKNQAEPIEDNSQHLKKKKSKKNKDSKHLNDSNVEQNDSGKAIATSNEKLSKKKKRKLDESLNHANSTKEDHSLLEVNDSLFNDGNEPSKKKRKNKKRDKQFDDQDEVNSAGKLDHKVNGECLKSNDETAIMTAATKSQRRNKRKKSKVPSENSEKENEKDIKKETKLSKKEKKRLKILGQNENESSKQNDAEKRKNGKVEEDKSADTLVNGDVKDYQMRKKSKKNSHNSVEEQAEACKDSPQIQIDKKQKKKKNKALAEKNGNVSESPMEDNDDGLKKKVKVKAEGRLNDTLVEDEQSHKGFSWKMSIKKILKKNPDEGLKLKKLEKQVLADYYAHEGATLAINEVKAMLKKKLNSDKFVLLKDHVKLKKVEESS